MPHFVWEFGKLPPAASTHSSSGPAKPRRGFSLLQDFQKPAVRQPGLQELIVQGSLEAIMAQVVSTLPLNMCPTDLENLEYDYEADLQPCRLLIEVRR